MNAPSQYRIAEELGVSEQAIQLAVGTFLAASAFAASANGLAWFEEVGAAHQAGKRIETAQDKAFYAQYAVDSAPDPYRRATAQRAVDTAKADAAAQSIVHEEASEGAAFHAGFAIPAALVWGGFIAVRYKQFGAGFKRLRQRNK
jgi:hypothetical protein